MSHVESVEPGHFEVEKCNIGPVLFDRIQRRAGVADFCNDLDPSARRQASDNPLPIYRVIVGDDHFEAL
jgi:hypothetical protein